MAAVLGILGVDTGYHPAAALIVDGTLIAFAEEDRFTGTKNGVVPFPSRAVAYCLEAGGVTPGDLDLIAYGWDCERYRWEMPARMAWQFWRNRRTRRAKAPPLSPTVGQDSWLRGATFLAVHRPGWVQHRIVQGFRRLGYSDALPRVRFFPHHRCHAATAFFCSGRDEAAVLVMDGSGEEVATTGWVGRGTELRRLWSLDLPNSLGWFYSGMTEYLGFEHSRHEGKTMGLAAYGRPVDEIRRTMEEIVRIQPDGSHDVDPSWGKFGRCSLGEHFSDRVVERFGPPRQPNAPIEQHHKDLAWATQSRLEEAVLGVVGKLTGETDLRDLCMAGGVTMNCKMNGVVARSGHVDSLFVQPAADDSGAALGAALLGAMELGDDPRFTQQRADFGPAICSDEAKGVLEECGLSFTEPADLPAEVAQLIAGGKVVGWAQGRLETGARALGQRSILALPTDPGMADHVNHRVKRREAWRPYAPSMTSQGSAQMFGQSRQHPFMIVAEDVDEDVAQALPSVVHVDRSVRPQVVDAKQNPAYHALLEELGRETGHEVVLNTSFNVRGKPIVLGPREAIATFASTGLDALALGPFLAVKER